MFNCEGGQLRSFGDGVQIYPPIRLNPASCMQGGPYTSGLYIEIKLRRSGIGRVEKSTKWRQHSRGETYIIIVNSLTAVLYCNRGEI